MLSILSCSLIVLVLLAHHVLSMLQQRPLLPQPCVLAKTFVKLQTYRVFSLTLILACLVDFPNTL
jgi:hypothetical protein